MRTVLFVLKYLLLVDSTQQNVVYAGFTFLSLCSWHTDHPDTTITEASGVVKKNVGQRTVPCPTRWSAKSALNG